MQLLVMIVGMGAIMYFLIIRPQQTEAKKLKEMREGLSKGDKIVTAGGLIVKVVKVEEEFIKVELGKDTVVQITKDAVARKYEDEA
jgi:preprotein translocase subunit YajC